MTPNSLLHDGTPLTPPEQGTSKDSKPCKSSGRDPASHSPRTGGGRVMGYCHTPYFWDDAIPQPSLEQRNAPPQPRDHATPPAPEQRNPLSPRRSIRRTRARAGRRERAADSPRWRMRVAPSPPYRPAPQSRARTGWGRGSCGGVSRVGGVSRRGVCHRGAPCPWCGRRRRRRRLGCRRGGRSAARGRMDVMSPQQEHLGPGRSSSVSGESRVFAAADGKKVGLLLWKS